MKHSYIKDILRTIRKNAKRFMALMAITALGLTVFVGIHAACRDLYLTADRFYDEQKLFDIRVLSTLGLTEEDVETLQAVEGVEVADGDYTETVYTMVGELRQSAAMTRMSTKGLNTPYLVEGALPQSAGEIAVTQSYLDDTGKQLGGTLTIEETMDEADAPEDTKEAETPPESTPREPEATEAEAENDTADDATEDDGPDTDIEWDAEVEIEEEAETPNFLNTQYTITGVVIDPMNTANNEGSTAFRANTGTDYTFFVTAADVDTGGVYTSVSLTLRGLAALDCYSDAYVDAVQEAIGLIETRIMEQREQARHDAIMEEALAKIADAETTMNEKFGEADAQFEDAWAEIEEAKQELLDGEAELTREERDALQKLADARAELEDGKAKLRAGEAELAAGEAELASNTETLEKGARQLEKERKKAEDGFKKAEKQFKEKQKQLNASRNQLLPGIEQLKAPFGDQWPTAAWDALVSASATATAGQLAAAPQSEPDPAAVAAATANEQAALAAALGAIIQSWGDPTADVAGITAGSVQSGLGLGIVEGGQQAMDAQKAAYDTQKADALQQLEDAEAELEDGREQLEAGRVKLDAARVEISTGWATLANGEATLNAEEAKALRELADAWRELAEGRQELAEGEQELTENAEKYAGKKAEAQQKLADSYTELEDIDMAQWYVQDRLSLDSYSSLDTDLTSINAIGTFFPILFLVVAILISLTTMTRMVEEERGLIGTYKALGMGSGVISWKYLFYALAASLAGSLLGSLLGFIALPKALVVILRSIYIFPNVTLYFDVLYGGLGALLFTGSIMAATALACQHELRRTPATLMRPKAPRAGSRILLERVPVLWRRFRFLNKVTARNLFRYKKRLMMTVVGIAGCTALVLAGFAIRDSVTAMMPKQYENLYRYDLMAVVDAEDNDKLTRRIQGDAVTEAFISVRVESAKVLNAEGASESVQMTVVPNGASLEPYIHTPNTRGEVVTLGEEGVLLTQNAAELLGLAPGSTATLQTLQLDRCEVTVSDVVENYLGNNVFISQAVYEAGFGPLEPNAVYAHLADGVDQPAYTHALQEEDWVLSAVSTQELREQFATNFAVLNAVIYVLILLAAGLAFVVLFTLASTNISERARELATIKVLGFFDREVHAYVNKETLILTLIGVLAGMPLGTALSGLLMAVLKMPALYFALEIRPLSYLISGAVSFSFALVVNLITNRVLDKIDMVEALKSVE